MRSSAHAWSTYEIYAHINYHSLSNKLDGLSIIIIIFYRFILNFPYQLKKKVLLNEKIFNVLHFSYYAIYLR